MRGLRIIPLFIGLIILSYFGMWFVELNRSDVVINLGTRQTPPTALGFVVLTSILIGMIVSGLFCSIEILVLYMQNRRLKAKVPSHKSITPATTATTGSTATQTPSDRDLTTRATGRFT